MSSDDLARIGTALERAAEALRPFTPGDIDHVVKAERGDPLTEADLAVNRVLHDLLPRPGEGWLSEETRDDPVRLKRRRVWIVDPIDGTREFVDGIPEWCVSVALVEDGLPVAGGICNPVRQQTVLGGAGMGLTLNGERVRPRPRSDLAGALALASRSEVRRGEWDRFAEAPFAVRACGSVAYKLGLVAAGLADLTFTLVPKSEWDVAAGAALVLAAGGAVLHADGSEPRFNLPDSRMPDFLAGAPHLLRELRARWLAPPRGDG